MKSEKIESNTENAKSRALKPVKSKLKNSHLAEQVQQQIYEYILEKPFAIGEKIPNEFELAEKFGVGRSTVREAVKLLISRGILSVRQGSGTYVMSTTPAEQDPLGLGGEKNKMALALDLVEARLILEPGIAEQAAIHATKEQIEALQKICESVEKKIRAGEDYIEEDIAFHRCVAECSGNRVIRQLVPIIDSAVLMFVDVTHQQLKEETILTHQAVVDAIALHDPVGARSAMVMHMTFNRRMIQKSMQKEQSSND